MYQLVKFLLIEITKILKNLTDHQDLSAHIFPPKICFQISHRFEISQNQISVGMVLDFPLISPKINNIGFGSHGHVRNSENYENEGLSNFPKMNPKNTGPTMKQNNSTELSGFSYNNIYCKNDPPDPLDPKSRCFPDYC